MTHMDKIKPFNAELVTHTYIKYAEHKARGQPIVRRVRDKFVDNFANNFGDKYRKQFGGDCG